MIWLGACQVRALIDEMQIAIWNRRGKSIEISNQEFIMAWQLEYLMQMLMLIDGTGTATETLRRFVAQLKTN